MNEGLLTNREVSSLLIVGGAVVFAISQPKRSEIFRSTVGVLRTALAPKIVIPLVTYCTWLLVTVLAANRIGLWESALWKPFTLWLLFSGLVLVVSLNDAIQKPGFFRSALVKTVGAGAFVEFLSALQSFPLWFELPAQLIAVFFAGVAAVATYDPKLAPARRAAVGYLAAFGLLSLVWAMAHVWRDWDVLDKATLIKELAMPIWLTPAALLFVYLFAVVATYEGAFMRMRFRAKGRSVRRQQLAMVARGNVRLDAVKLFSTGVAARRLADAMGFRGAWREIGYLRQEAKDRAAAERIQNSRLMENAGVEGVDESGRRLDRREFEATQNSLRWLATCHMGHYRNGNQLYRADLLPLVASHFERHGLPKQHGIEMLVSPEGTGWWAFRRTVTGWWFAIGAAGPPPDEWLYDGPLPPSGMPAEPEWDRFAPGRASRNWI
ncbi:MAG: hypothetical protein WEB00_05090 [Dehalococcoidia bacterium]